MRNRKIYFRSVLTFVIGVLTLASCNKDDDQPAALDALADVFVQKVSVDGVEKFSLAFFVQGNKEIKSVSVQKPGDGGDVVDLVADTGNSSVFRWFPEDDDYSTDVPEPGDYEFTITSTQLDEVPIVLTDSLQNIQLGDVLIDSLEYSDDQLKTTWETIEDADNYVVKLYNEEGEAVFVSPLVDADKAEFAFGVTSSGWLTDEKAQDSETYKVELMAVLFESESGSDKTYNIQYISLDSQEIIWGE